MNETTFKQEEQVKQILTHVKFIDNKIGDLIAENVHQTSLNHEADLDLKISRYLLKNLTNCISNYKKINK